MEDSLLVGRLTEAMIKLIPNIAERNHPVAARRVRAAQQSATGLGAG
jgi:hypothetical protein